MSAPALLTQPGACPTPQGGAEMAKTTPAERFWAKVDKNGPVPDYAPHLGPCWLWTRHLGTGDYGDYQPPGPWSSRRVHRISYQLLVGPVPEGLELDHLCRVRHCVNPAHLEPVTRAENRRRGTNWQGDKTHCIHGHPFDEANTYVYRSGKKRQCRACSAASARASYARARAPQETNQ